jgi:Na+-transporting methylmalonyl-CoA/oxaloacetate decarboxylase gamma subunit
MISAVGLYETTRVSGCRSSLWVGSKTSTAGAADRVFNFFWTEEETAGETATEKVGAEEARAVEEEEAAEEKEEVAEEVADEDADALQVTTVELSSSSYADRRRSMAWGGRIAQTLT